MSVAEEPITATKLPLSFLEKQMVSQAQEAIHKVQENLYQIIKQNRELEADFNLVLEDGEWVIHVKES